MNLDEQPLEEGLRQVLTDPDTASAVLWITPEVAESVVIREVEIPALAARQRVDSTFALIPVAAGGLDYAAAAAVARSATSLVDLSAWNIARIQGDPASLDDVHAVAARVLHRRLQVINDHLDADAPVVVDVHTRGPVVWRRDATLTIDLTHLFDGRYATDESWQTVLRALGFTLNTIAVQAPGRPVHLRGLVGLPAAVALGACFPATASLDLSWVQYTPGLPESLFTVRAKAEPSGFTVRLQDNSLTATNIAVLVSVSEDTVPAFQATPELPPFRGVVHASTADALSPMLSPGQALDLAHTVIKTVRSARSRYGTVGEVHLFVAGPAGFAFLLGQLLNTLSSVVTYEHRSDSATGMYVNAATLLPSK